jgi:hypothetical protein
MGVLANAYRSRARRVRPVSQAVLGAEAKIAKYGIQEGLEVELYERTPLKVTRAMYRSVSIRFLGRAFQIGYNTSIAPYAPIREKASGVSKSGGHVLDIDPAAYMRRNFGAQIALVRSRALKAIHGRGARSGGA